MSKAKAKTKAKGKKGAAPLPPKEQAEDARPAANVPLISAAKLNKLLDADNGYKDEIDEVVGVVREKIGDAVERDHLHKGAYADLKRYDRIKSPEKLAERWSTLMAYMEMRGLFERINTVQRLDLGDEPPAPKGETEHKTGPKFGGPAGRVAELAEATGAQPSPPAP